MSENNVPKISIIMPLLNEEKYISNCIESLLKQDYSLNEMEWIFVDGMSKDKTIELLKNYQNKYPGLIFIYKNPNKTVPYAMNVGISHARGKYIIRLDAHADYATDYFSKCVYYLDTIDADNVGGVADTKARTKFGETIAKMLSSKFGVGDSQFRTNGSSGYVDTVPFGAFRKEVFEKWGGYDERLTRNQDNEMNYRIRKNGGKIWLAEDIHFTYYCRETLADICRMALQNGKWNIITMKLCPGSMSLRHFVPLGFVLSLILAPVFIVSIPLFKWFFGLELVTYFILDIFFAFKLTDNFGELCKLILLFPMFHIAYGMGSLNGILNVALKRFSK